MLPDDENILRWLNQAGDDEPLRLDGAPVEGESAEVQSDWKRLEWVRGILGTLDHQMAPGALDALVEKEEADRQRNLALGLDTWITTVAWSDASDEDREDWIEPVLAPSKAPEFLDRIVEERLSAIEAQLRGAKARHKRAQWVKRASLALTGVLVLALVPWGNLHTSTAKPIRLIEHASLDSLRSAHPDQVRFARLSGDFGALGEDPTTEGGVR